MADTFGTSTQVFFGHMGCEAFAGTILAEAWRIMIFGPQGMWEEWEQYTYW